MRCVSYMRKDSFWRDERSAFHERFRKKNKAAPYYDLDGNLIAQQREHIKAYAQKLGWEVEEEYIDIEGRDEFDRLKRDCIGRKFDRVITDSFYRFSDRLGDARITMEEVFIPVGIEVAVAEDRFCSSLATKNGIEYYFRNRATRYANEGSWEERKKLGSKRPYNTAGEPLCWQGGPPILGTSVHDGDTGDVFRYTGSIGKGVLYRRGDSEILKWEIPCPVISLDDILEIVTETLRREKSAAEYARENIYSEAAEKKRASMVAPLKERTAPLVEETKALLEKRMRRRKRSEAENTDAAAPASDDNFDAEECRDNERLDQIEAELKGIVEELRLIEMAYSYSNLWIKRFMRMEIPERIQSKFLKLYIDDIRIYGLEQWGEYTVKVFMPNNEYRSLLPEEWMPDHTYTIVDAVGKPDSVKAMGAGNNPVKADAKETAPYRREGGK